MTFKLSPVNEFTAHSSPKFREATKQLIQPANYIEENLSCTNSSTFHTTSESRRSTVEYRPIGSIFLLFLRLPVYIIEDFITVSPIRPLP